ncbi:MAG TPA: hypothetical protein VEI06_09380 [Gemmatimonadaceae bacterium]|nr:hypothetical protein [Gemmatimonadaceae bacterium]
MRNRPSRLIGVLSALQLVVGMAIMPPAMPQASPGAHSLPAHAMASGSDHMPSDGMERSPTHGQQQIPCQTQCCDQCPCCGALVKAPEWSAPAWAEVSVPDRPLPVNAAAGVQRAPELRLPFPLGPPALRS